jgi:hypothetical protein
MGERCMVSVKSVKIDGESLYFFNSALYIFESSKGQTLQLDIIVSEVAVRRYKGLENLILEIELEDGRIINSIMTLKILSGGLPQLNLYSELFDHHEYSDLDIVHEDDSFFPDLESGLTIEDIRKVEMPYEDMKLKLTLPIDQVEWLKSQKKNDLNQLFSEFIMSRK